MPSFLRSSRLLVLAAAVCALLAFWLLRGDKKQDDAVPKAVATEQASEEEAGAAPGTSRVVRPRNGSSATTTDPAMAAQPPPIDQRVQGRVTSLANKKPTPFVDVIFSKKGSEWTATSDNEGQYSLALAPGSYQVRAIGDQVMAMNLPALVVASEAMTYDLSVVEHSVIRGFALFADRSPAVGAIVVPELDSKSAKGLSTRGELGSAEVLPDGSFELYTVQGNLILHVGNESASGTTKVANLKAGEEREEVEVVLVPNGYVAGIVQGPLGAPIDSARVLISMQIPGTGEYDRVPVETNRRGRFRYQVLRPTHTIVDASARGYAHSTPVSFSLKPGESREDIELVLHEATFSLVGHVLNSEGEAIAFAEVAQGQEGSKERYKKAYTNSEGRFEIADVGPGPHRLRVRKKGYQQTRLSDITAPADDLSIVMPTESPQEAP